MSQFFRISQENQIACTKTEQIIEKDIKHNGRTLLTLRLTGGGVNFVFYHLSSLHFTSSLYLCQLLLSPHSMRRDTDAVATVVIVCLFHRVGHHLRRRQLFRI